MKNRKIDEIYVQLDNGAYMPERAYKDDAGLDLKATEDRWVYRGECVKFDTGVHVLIPKDYVGLLTSKSGLMSKGITSRGTIDSGFTGTIKVVLYNDGEESYLVRKGDKISQLIIFPIIRPQLVLVDDLGKTDRGDNGFGSSGR